MNFKKEQGGEREIQSYVIILFLKGKIENLISMAQLLTPRKIASIRFLGGVVFLCLCLRGE